jgi:hypothetical protein
MMEVVRPRFFPPFVPFVRLTRFVRRRNPISTCSPASSSPSFSSPRLKVSFSASFQPLPPHLSHTDAYPTSRFTDIAVDGSFPSFPFFCSVRLTCTSPFAGWALTLLSKDNLSYASTAQTIGLNSGYFLSFTVFLAFNSVEFSFVFPFSFSFSFLKLTPPRL